MPSIIMLNVADKPFMLNCVMLVIMLSVIMLSVIMLGVIMLSVAFLSVIMLSVIMLSVVAPLTQPTFFSEKNFSVLIVCQTRPCFPRIKLTQGASKASS